MIATPVILHTERLILRPWRQEDFEPLAKLTSDPRVMEFFPATLTREESDQLASRLKENIEKNGYGFWAVELKGIAPFIGFIGIGQVSFMPCVEIGWRLIHEFWGKGYALEGARAALHFGFETLHLEEIVALTTLHNMRSRRVMEKLGMHHDPASDFDHPKIAEGHPLRRHVLYRIKQSEISTPSNLL